MSPSGNYAINVVYCGGKHGQRAARSTAVSSVWEWGKDGSIGRFRLGMAIGLAA
jgi:hypothetical protein